jgi:hypothetical protein
VVNSDGYIIVVFIGYKPTTMRIWWWSGWWFGTRILCCHYIGNNHRNWLLYFSEGFKPPTRCKINVCMEASFAESRSAILHGKFCCPGWYVIDLCLERHAIDFQPCIVSIWILICVCVPWPTHFLVSTLNCVPYEWQTRTKWTKSILFWIHPIVHFD